MGWKDFVNRDNEELAHIRSFSPFQLEAKIAIFMDEGHRYESYLEVGAVVDCFFNVYVFANDHKLNDDELVFLLKLQSKLLENCEKDFGIQDNLNFLCDSFKEDVDDTNAHKALSALTTSKHVIDYMMQSFFQHYELYQHIFHYSQTEEVVTKEISIDVIPVVQPYPPPLEESVTAEWYNLYLNPQAEVEEDNVVESEEVVSADTPIPVEEDLNEGDSESKVRLLLASLDKDDMKKMIKEITEKRLAIVKTELESKVKEKEALLLKNLEKSMDRLKVS